MPPFHVDLSEHAPGIVLCDIHTALRDHGHIVHEYLGNAAPSRAVEGTATVDPAAWSDGTFLYIPPGVDLDVPLQVDVAVSGRRSGPNNRTLVVVDEGSRVHYIDGCSAPTYTAHSTRSALVEIIVKPNAHVTWSSVQNWSSGVHAAVVKQARVGSGGHLRLVDGFFGSTSTEASSTVLLDGPAAGTEVSSILYAGAGQHVHETIEVIHGAPQTTSEVISKAICAQGGATVTDWSVEVAAGAFESASSIAVDALVLDDLSSSTVHPHVTVAEPTAQVDHDAVLSRISDEQRFYLTARGLSDDDALALIVGGFIGPITSSLPPEYSVEWTRLIELHLDGLTT